jgi:hypothetical protein
MGFAKGGLFCHSERNEESLIGLSAGTKGFLVGLRALEWKNLNFSAACRADKECNT